jgi:hypothetical protein
VGPGEVCREPRAGAVGVPAHVTVLWGV